MNITNLKTAACYIRVSTDKQEELSPDSQLKEIKRYAKDHGYILHSDYIFIEQEGISGKRAEKRPAFQQIADLIEQTYNEYFKKQARKPSPYYY